MTDARSPDVSCKLLDLWFRELKRKKLPPSVLLEGTDLTIAKVRNKHEWIDWPSFVRILANVGKVWSNEELEHVGGAVLRSPYMRPVSLVARLLFTAPEIYRWAFETKGIGNEHIKCLEHSFAEVSSHHFTMRIEVRAGYEPSPEFFVITKSVLAAAPNVLALPPAKVVMTRTGRGATYEVVVPQGGGTLARIKKALLWPFTVRATAQALKEANETLTQRYHELDQARSDLARKAQQLQTVNALGRELTRTTRLDALAGAIDKLLRDRFGASAVAMWLTMREGGTLAEVHRSGSSQGSPTRQLHLSVATDLLGRIDLWGVDASPASDLDLLDDLVPWLSIALENARSFALLREYQTSLETKVADRTEQLQASLRQAVEADRQKTAFFGNASHELRTPLTLILAPLEALAVRSDLSESTRGELKSALRNCYRLLKLVNDILDMSAIEDGQMRLRLGTCDLTHILQEAMRPWRAHLANRGVHIEEDLPASVFVVGDAERLEQVALNLVANAVRHTPDRGTIRLAAAEKESVAEFSVANTGEGIDPEDIPGLFQRFAQASHSGSRRFGTSGLGLAVSKELVELHKGKITVENEPGVRVQFRVCVPKGSPEDAHAVETVRPSPAELRLYEGIAVPAPPPSAGAHLSDVSGATLLIVEDHPDMRGFLARELSGEFRVIEAADGAQGLALAREKLPEVILSDLMLPAMDGSQLCKALKEDASTSGIPFVLLTARSDLNQKLAALEGGADDYIVKPFHIDEVRSRLRGQLRLRQLAAKVAETDRLASVGTLVAGVAHEIRNPLNSMLNALLPVRDLLAPGSQDAVQLLDIAIAGCRRVDEISSLLLQQARAGEGTVGSVNLGANLSLALQLLSHKVAKGPQLDLRLPNRSVEVIGEAGALNQVLVNLIDNAIAAAGRKGRVTVTLEDDPQTASVEVSDDGPGIDPANLKRIFDPFFTTRSPGGGTGLGLSVARAIVERHLGQISVSSAPGAGARFRVTLPKRTPPAPNVRRAFPGSSPA